MAEPLLLSNMAHPLPTMSQQASHLHSPPRTHPPLFAISPCQVGANTCPLSHKHGDEASVAWFAKRRPERHPAITRTEPKRFAGRGLGRGGVYRGEGNQTGNKRDKSCGKKKNEKRQPKKHSGTNPAADKQHTDTHSRKKLIRQRRKQGNKSKDGTAV